MFPAGRASSVSLRAARHDPRGAALLDEDVLLLGGEPRLAERFEATEAHGPLGVQQREIAELTAADPQSREMSDPTPSRSKVCLVALGLPF
jgi:hypothetical protein